jgi:hypothetical protein
MYTDGFEAVFGGVGGETGLRLGACVGGAAAGGAGSCVGRLGAAADAAAGSLHQCDDLTALLVVSS